MMQLLTRVVGQQRRIRWREWDLLLASLIDSFTDLLNPLNLIKSLSKNIAKFLIITMQLFLHREMKVIH